LSLDSVRTISTGGFHPEMANVSSSSCKVWWRWQGGRLSWKWTSPHRLPFVRPSGDSRNAHLRNPLDNVFGIRKCMYLINTVFIGFEKSKLCIILSDPFKNKISINAGNGI
jgi:hypothetical protein